MAENTRLKELSGELKRISETVDQREAASIARFDRLESSMQMFSRAIDTLTRSVDHLNKISATGASFDSGATPRSPSPASIHSRLRYTWSVLLFPGFKCFKRQINSLPRFVAHYYTKFMVFANRVQGLSDDALLDCFVGLPRNSRSSFSSLSSLKGPPLLSGPSVNSAATSGPNSKASLPPLLPTPSSKPLPPVKRLSPSEMQLRRDKGLCFTFDEKYSCADKCPNRHYMILQFEHDDDEGPCAFYSPLNNPESSLDDNPSPMHLSLCAYQCSYGIGTIRFTGSINGIEMQVMLDGGSSDNFIQPRIALHLDLPIEPAPGLRVVVGSSHILTGEGVIHHLPLLIQGHLLNCQHLCHSL
ncbi:Aspartic peptidase domain superfamily [Sesbania bispinosa]|nr:Aspartic peptidase domain superfamily [Sesbania bispinosa]